MEQYDDKRGGAEIEIRLSAYPEYLKVVRSAVEKTAEVAGMGQGERESVILAVGEALANVIKHSYGGPCSKPIVVRLTKLAPADHGKGALEIVVRDYGRQVDPGSIKSRDLDDIRPGGLGVHIINSVMDEMEYSCPVEGGLELRMVKYFVV